MIELEDVPELRDPVMIAAFEGWNDAGEAATRRDRAPRARSGTPSRRGARPGGLLRLPGQPAAGRRSTDGRRRITWPTTRILLAPHRPASTATSSSSHGIEPSMRWRAFTHRAARARRSGSASTTLRHRSARCWPTCRTPGPIPVTATPATTRRSGRPLGARAVPLRGTDRHRRRAQPTPPPRPACRRCRCWAAVPHYAGAAALARRRRCLLRRIEELLGRHRPARRAGGGGPGLGARRRRARRRPTTRSPSTSSRSRRRRTPPTCPRPAARRSRGSSSATCAAATTSPSLTTRPAGSTRRLGSGAARGGERQSRTPSRASTGAARPARGAGRRRRGPGCSRRPTGPPPPGRAGVSRSSASAARARRARVAVRGRSGVDRHRRPPGREPLPAPAPGPRRSTPSRAVVVRQQRQPDRHRVDARSRAARETSTRLPLDLLIFSPSSPTIAWWT